MSRVINEVDEAVRLHSRPTPGGQDMNVTIVRKNGFRENPVYDGDYGLVSEPPEDGDIIILSSANGHTLTYVHLSAWSEPPLRSALNDHAGKHLPVPLK